MSCMNSVRKNKRDNNPRQKFTQTCVRYPVTCELSKYCQFVLSKSTSRHMGRVKRIRYLSPVRAAKVPASLRIRAVSPEPLLLAHTSSESRVTFRQKARSLAPLNGWACAVKICHDGMCEYTNSLDSAHILSPVFLHKVTSDLISAIKWVPSSEFVSFRHDKF